MDLSFIKCPQEGRLSFCLKDSRGEVIVEGNT